jgi:hypothetical protein
MTVRRRGTPRQQERTWDELVEAGRKLANSHQFPLGDLAAEVETEHGEGKLAQYAAEIGVPLKTLEQYRTVARAWPLEDRSSNWTVCKVLASQDDRFELLAAEPDMTVRRAREIVAGRKPPEENREPSDEPEPREEEPKGRRRRPAKDEWVGSPAYIAQSWANVADAVGHVADLGEPTELPDVKRQTAIQQLQDALAVLQPAGNAEDDSVIAIVYHVCKASEHLRKAVKLRRDTAYGDDLDDGDRQTIEHHLAVILRSYGSVRSSIKTKADRAAERAREEAIRQRNSKESWDKLFRDAFSRSRPAEPQFEEKMAKLLRLAMDNENDHEAVLAFERARAKHRKAQAAA